MTQNIYSKLQQLGYINRLTASGPCGKITVSLWPEQFPFVACVIWMTTKLYFRSIHKSCSRTDRRYDRSPVHTAVTLNTAVTAVGSDCTAHCCVVTERYSNTLVTDA